MPHPPPCPGRPARTGNVSQPLDHEQLDVFRLGYCEPFRTQLANDERIAGRLLGDLRTGRPSTFHQQLVDQSAELTATDLRSTLQSTYGEAVFVDFKGGDAAAFEK